MLLETERNAKAKNIVMLSVILFSEGNSKSYYNNYYKLRFKTKIKKKYEQFSKENKTIKLSLDMS